MSSNLGNTIQNLPGHYSGKYEGSFAYLTIKDRLPIILVKVIDHLCQNKNSIKQLYGETAVEEAKEIIGNLSGLQNEMVTGKPIKALICNSSDAVTWNEYLKNQENLYGFPPAWFESAWLYVECYLYRRIKQAFELSPNMKNYDPFHQQKKDSFLLIMDSASFLYSSMKKTLSNFQTSQDKTNLSLLLQQYLEISLWGNKWDLSISAGKENSEQTSSVPNLDQLRDYILVNNTDHVFQLLKCSNHSTGVVIDFVLDNAGFELFCDFILMHFLSETKLASQIRLHVKKMPWFVSDTLCKDIDWLLKTLSQSQEESLVEFGKHCTQRLSVGIWEVVEESFWTLPHDFSEMSSADPALYDRLSKSDLIVFKGDLNYRKLTGDRMWEETTDFNVALNGFLPTSLVSLRTIKADVVVGLESGTSEKLCKEHSQNWKFSGDFALIQCAKKCCNSL